MPSRCTLRMLGLLPLLLASLAMPRPAGAWDDRYPAATDFVAMAEGRFAGLFPLRGGLVVRFATGQFGSEDTAEIDFGVGYTELDWDPVSDKLLLYRNYEGSGQVIAYTPEGRELHRVRLPEAGDGIALIPGAGLLAVIAGADLDLVDCRTGASVRRAPLAEPGGRVSTVTVLDSDLILVLCTGDKGRELVLLDWRADRILWRQPASTFESGGRGLAAADSTRIYTLSQPYTGKGANVTSRSRHDGALLATMDLPGDWCWLFAVAGEARLLFVSSSPGKGGRLQLLDPESLAPESEVELPAGLQVHGMRSARALGNGRILLTGTFVPDPGPLARSDRTSRHLLLDLAAVPPRARIFSDLLAVDPEGRGWQLGTRQMEVVGEVPWLEPADLDAATDLPVGVRGYRQEIATGSGPGPRVVSVMRQTEPADAAALHKLMDGADLCFTGTLATTTTHCVGRNGRPDDGVIEADFTIDQLLWGPDVATQVYIDGFNLPGCVTFDPPRRLAPERFVPGRRYLVVARWLDDGFVVRGPGLFALDPDAPSADRQGGLAVPDPAADARDFAARIDLASQFERADVVVRLGAVDERGVSIAGMVTQVYKGDDALCRVEVWAEPGGFHELRHLVSGSSRGDAPEGDPVLFLKQCGAGRYELLEGSWSVLRHGRGGSWARPGGLREPRAEAVLGGA
ncbi:MAG: hypothetical protein IPP62_05980 [bacterium]|nr:hypothetical protein [bacterium]